MRRERLAALVAAVLLVAGCGTSSDSQQARIDDLEARVAELETAQEQRASPRAIGNDSARQLQSTGDAAPTASSSTSPPDPSGEFEEMVFQAFSESVFLGSPLDPEFGGLTIAGDTGSLSLAFVGAGLDELGLLRSMLTNFGAAEAEVEELTRSGSEGSLSTSSPPIEVSWLWAGTDRLEVLLTN